jgi:hypothetical protein
VINVGLASPGIEAWYTDMGATTLPGSPADFCRLIASEYEKWDRVVKFAGIRRD